MACSFERFTGAGSAKALGADMTRGEGACVCDKDWAKRDLRLQHGTSLLADGDGENAKDAPLLHGVPVHYCYLWLRAISAFQIRGGTECALPSLRSQSLPLILVLSHIH